MAEQIILALIPAVASIISIWKLIDELMMNNFKDDKFCFLRAITYAVLAVLAMCYLISNFHLLANNKIKFFKKGGRRYYNFFSRWYSETGYITIYCKDLATWADIDEDNQGKRKVYNSLLKKSLDKQLSIFIGQRDKSSDRLKTAGSKVTIIPKNKAIHFSCSVRRSDDIYSIIVRNKKRIRAIRSV